MNETFPHAAFARIILFGSVVINVFVVSAVALSENVIAQQESQLMLNVVVDGATIQDKRDGRKAVIGKLNKGMHIYSLRVDGGFHQIFDPSSHRLGWVWSQHVQPIEYSAKDVDALAQAKSIHKQAMKRLKEIDPQLFSLGSAAEVTAVREEVRPKLVQSLNTRMRILGETHPVVAESQLALATAYRLGRQKELADPLYRECLRIREMRFGPNHELSLQAIDGLLTVSNERSLFEKRYQVLKVLRGPEEKETLRALHLLAMMLGLYSDPDAASVFRQAIDKYERICGETAEETIEVVMDAGLYHVESGDLETGFKLLRSVIKKEDGSLMVNNLVRELDSIEPLLKDFSDDVDRKLAIRIRSIKLMDEFVGEDDLNVAWARYQLTRELIRQKQFAKALPYARDAAKYLKKHVGPIDLKSSQALLTLAELLMHFDHFDEAEKLLLQQVHAFENARKGKDTLWFLATNTWNALSILYARNAEFAKAADFADRTIQYKRRLSNQSPRFRLRLLGDTGVPALGLSLGILDKAESRVAARSAEWLLNTKAAWVDDAATVQLIPSDNGKLRKLHSLRSQLASAIQHFDANQYDAIAKEIDDLAPQIDALEFELWKSISDEPRTERRWFTLSDIQESLDDRTALVSIARFEQCDFKNVLEWSHEKPDIYAAWITTRTNSVAIKLGSANEINLVIEKFHNAISKESLNALSRDGEATATRKLKASNDDFRRMIWDPIASILDDRIECVVVSPASDIWRVPWTAIQAKNGKFLIEDYSIRYVSSGRDLIRTGQDRPSPSSSVVFGNPNFGGIPKVAWSRSELQPLPWTAVEARSIQASLNGAGRSVSLHLGTQASEKKLKSLSSPRILSVSTHGFFWSPERVQSALPDRIWRIVGHPLFRCGFVLAASGEAEADGIVTGIEIASLDFRGTELVVLSACDTGVGEFSGGNGVYGLRQAFTIAGAASVIGSHWQVDDKATARLMNDFFNNLSSGQSKSQALRQAQLARIKARRARHGAAHPFFWAAFTLTGQD